MGAGCQTGKSKKMEVIEPIKVTKEEKFIKLKNQQIHISADSNDQRKQIFTIMEKYQIGQFFMKDVLDPQDQKSKSEMQEAWENLLKYGLDNMKNKRATSICFSKKSLIYFKNAQERHLLIAFHLKNAEF